LNLFQANTTGSLWISTISLGSAEALDGSEKPKHTLR
jgi:hypothetical protein